MGASFDGDARVISAGLDWNMANNRLAGFDLSRLELNVDGVAGSNMVSLIAQDLYQASLYYQCLLFEGRLSLGVSMLSRELITPQLDIERRIFNAAWEYRF